MDSTDAADAAHMETEDSPTVAAVEEAESDSGSSTSEDEDADEKLLLEAETLEKEVSCVMQSFQVIHHNKHTPSGRCVKLGWERSAYHSGSRDIHCIQRLNPRK